MIRFAICDDDYALVGCMETMILALNSSYNIEFDVMVFLSGEEFCKNLEEGKQYDIILMDIKMNGITGIEVGRILRENIKNSFTLLIFISNYRQYYQSVLELDTFCFINKPIQEALFYRKISAAINKTLYLRQYPINPFFSFKQGRSQNFVPLNEIIYLESRNRIINLYTKDQSYGYYSNLNMEHKKLPKNKFVRIHQSYIINFDYLKTITNKSIILTDGKEFIISSNYRKVVKEAYIQYRGEILWT